MDDSQIVEQIFIDHNLKNSIKVDSTSCGYFFLLQKNIDWYVFVIISRLSCIILALLLI